jgi:hypothetical protein
LPDDKLLHGANSLVLHTSTQHVQRLYACPCQWNDKSKCALADAKRTGPDTGPNTSGSCTCHVMLVPHLTHEPNETPLSLIALRSDA